MESDPFVAEIDAIRERIAVRFNYDVTAIGRYMRERDAHGDRVVVKREPRRPVKLPSPPAKTA